MASKQGFSPSRNLATRPWFSYETGRVAGQLYAWCLANEYYTYRRRFRNMTLYRLATGEEPPIVLGLWMSKRVATTLLGYESNFAFPHRNVIYSAMDTLENRIGTVRPFVQTLPKGADFALRIAAREADAFTDRVFEQQRYYETLRLVFRDMFVWGQGFVKVYADDTSEDRGVVIERVLPDELLVDELATTIAPPRFMVQRRYMSRYDAMMAWGDDDNAAAAIRTAQSAFIGITGIRYEHDMICLLEGWKLPDAPDKPGRHVLCSGNTAIVDEEWRKDHFPFACARWSPQTLGYRSTGGAFAMAPVQIEINSKWEQILDAQKAIAYPQWLVAAGSKVTAKTMGQRPGAIHTYSGIAPEPIVPQAVNAEMYEDAMRWENFAYSLVGVTQQQVQGAKQPGINSGVALRLMVDVEDTRNKSRVIALEDFTVDVAKLTIECAAEVNPRVEIDGKKRSWKSIAEVLREGAYDIKKFPISSLPSTPEAQQQTVEEWYADGVIDRRAYFRLQQMPDLASFARLSTASDDLVAFQLDEIVASGKPVAPEPTLDDFAVAIGHAKARYNLERRVGASDDVLRALQQYIVLLSDLQPAAPAAPAAGPVVPSAQQGAGAPLAPPPVQVQPSISAPA